MSGFADDLDVMARDVADLLGSELVTVTDGTHSAGSVKAVMGARDSMDMSLGGPGGTAFDSREFVVHRADLGSVTPRSDGKTVVTAANGVRYQVTEATTEVDDRMWRLKTKRMRA